MVTIMNTILEEMRKVMLRTRKRKVKGAIKKQRYFRMNLKEVNKIFKDCGWFVNEEND